MHGLFLFQVKVPEQDLKLYFHYCKFFLLVSTNFEKCLTTIFKIPPPITLFHQVIHFIGSSKPWTYEWDPVLERVLCQPEQVSFNNELLQVWWDVFMSDVKVGGALKWSGWSFEEEWVEFEKVMSFKTMKFLNSLFAEQITS